MLGANPMNGQILHASGPLPSFEVATVKPWKPSARPISAPVMAKLDPVQGARRQETDRVHFIGQIDLLIMDAYNLPVGSERRILKGPRWVDSEADRYEVEGKIDASMFAALQRMTPEQQHEQVALLEQSLLAERFNLKVHFEIRGEASVFALVVAQGGPKLVPAKDGETTSLSRLKNEITAQAVTLEQFARSPLWTPIGDRLVLDKTGLNGKYDFTLKWRPDSLDESGAVESADDLPPLFDAIREQLGLKVVDAKAPLEVIVIDRIERPTRN
jgi:uncharacterized protein (TIGR03435 family)